MNPQEIETSAGESRFAALLSLLSSLAMKSLGVGAEDASRPKAPDFEAAQWWIDMLDLLREKTRGNLTPDEERMLGNVAGSLQLMYVERASRTGSTAEEKKAHICGDAEKESERTRTPESTTAHSPQPPPDEGKKPRFRKSYG